MTHAEKHMQIGVNGTDAHLLLAKRCFEVLLDEPREETRTLVPYALTHLTPHLSVLRYEPLEVVEKEDILVDLVGLLRSPDSIEMHLTGDFFETEVWLDEIGDLEVIRAWLCDEHALGKLDRMGKNRVKQVSQSGGMAALKNIATMVVRQRLCQKLWPAQRPFIWIDLYLKRLTDQQGEDTYMGKPNFECELVERRIDRVAEWATNKFKIVKNSLYYEGAGSTYLNHGSRSFSMRSLSIKAFEIVKGLSDSSWLARKGLAEA